MTLAPVALAALLTFATCVAMGMAINFENIVGVPLLVSVGTAFTIYFTLAWRRGATNLLNTSVARAVVFSALTTGLAFGSLCLSPHPGTCSLGILLMVSLGWTLICTLVLQPALLGPPRPSRV
jgi:predicted RND superfamily exporter protein